MYQIHHMLKMNKYLSHVISITLLHSNCRTNTYKHLTTRQCLCVNYVSEDFEFHHSSHCSVDLYTTSYGRFGNIYKCCDGMCKRIDETIKELDAENECCS
ncbi:hypothetical protein T4D_13506 [Trichinella pseudospiralis]|uniref:Uncharacterized protein n=1 Tax=Trichinella pseudospiralis TaxID=6337 RepID=A0A0V1FAS4_TRIPS|nr:hypothetical protein T4D_13506 [Trichinella pseudospiralis]